MTFVIHIMNVLNRFAFACTRFTVSFAIVAIVVVVITRIRWCAVGIIVFVGFWARFWARGIIWGWWNTAIGIDRGGWARFVVARRLVIARLVVARRLVIARLVVARRLVIARLVIARLVIAGFLVNARLAIRRIVPSISTRHTPCTRTRIRFVTHPVIRRRFRTVGRPFGIVARFAWRTRVFWCICEFNGHLKNECTGTSDGWGVSTSKRNEKNAQESEKRARVGVFRKRRKSARIMKFNSV